MSSCRERSAKQQHHLAIVLHLHFASLTTGPSDTKKSDMASHLSSAEQFLARRMLGTALGFFYFPPPQIPGVSVASMVCMHGPCGTSKRADHPDTGLHRSVLLTMEIFTSRSLVSQQLHTLTGLKQSATSRVISFLAPLRGSLYCRYPRVSGEAEGSFPSRALLLETFHSSNVPLAK